MFKSILNEAKAVSSDELSGVLKGAATGAAIGLAGNAAYNYAENTRGGYFAAATGGALFGGGIVGARKLFHSGGDMATTKFTTPAKEGQILPPEGNIEKGRRKIAALSQELEKTAPDSPRFNELHKELEARMDGVKYAEGQKRANMLLTEGNTRKLLSELEGEREALQASPEYKNAVRRKDLRASIASSSDPLELWKQSKALREKDPEQSQRLAKQAKEARRNLNFYKREMEKLGGKPLENKIVDNVVMKKYDKLQGQIEAAQKTLYQHEANKL